MAEKTFELKFSEGDSVKCAGKIVGVKISDGISAVRFPTERFHFQDFWVERTDGQRRLYPWHDLKQN